MHDSRSTPSRTALAFGAIALLVLVSAWPGLFGDWVGDDFHMVKSSLYGDWSEVLRVFSRHAGHYFGEVGDPSMTWPYRPFTMLTLLLPHALVPEPWLHHFVSFLIHLGTGGLLLSALLRQSVPERHPAARVVSLVLVALFLLHPLTVETYVYINGRSDLVAGMCLAAFATLLMREGGRSPVRWVLIVLVAFLGAASKATFIPAAVALWLGVSLRLSQPRDSLRLGLGLVLGIAGYFGLRVSNVALSGRLGVAENIANDWSLLADIPQLIAKSAFAIVSIRSEAMQSLAWELFQPFSISDSLGALVLLVTAAALVARRDYGGIVLMTGFVLTIAPCVVVSRAFWFGFDRYLYMPWILVILTVAPHVVAGVEATPRRRLLWVSLAGAILFLAALGTRTSSLAYIDQTTYEAAMIDDHPDDPTTVYYMALAAKKGGQMQRARSWLEGMPEPPWPAAVVNRIAVLATEASDVRLRDEAMEYGLRTQPDDLETRWGVMHWRYDRGELEDALQLAGSFRDDEELCIEAHRQLESWVLETESDDERERIRQTADDLDCVPPSN